MHKLAMLLIVPVVLVVWYYNYWAVGCGRCSYADIWSIGPLAMLLAGLIVIILGVLLYMRHRSKRPCECPKCQRPLDNVWVYCPDCGTRGR